MRTGTMTTTTTDSRTIRPTGSVRPVGGRRTALSLAVATALTLGAVACGNDDDEAIPTATNAAAGSALPAEYCDGLLALDAMAPMGGPDMAHAVKAHFAALVPVVEGMTTVAPATVTAPLGVVRTAVTEAAGTGESPFTRGEGPGALRRGPRARHVSTCDDLLVAPPTC
jgi:hypothetical protein